MRARRVALYFVAWTAAGLFFFSQDMSRKLFFGDPTPWWHYFVTWLIGVWIVAALTPAIACWGVGFRWTAGTGRGGSRFTWGSALSSPPSTFSWSA